MQTRLLASRTWTIAAMLVLGTFTAYAAKPDGKISGRSAEQLAAARVNGQSTVTILVALTPSFAPRVAAAIQALGGVIRYREDSLGYIRVVIAPAQVMAVANIVGVEAVELNEVIPIENPKPEGAAEVNVDPPTAATPSSNAYMPTRDIGAPQFVAANPTWDGRGVTIGIVDSGVTFDHPSLQTTSTGERKIVGWVTATDPSGDNDPTWINMKDQVSGGNFSYQGQVYIAPANSSYRIGLLNERDPRLGGEVGTDLNRDGNPAGSSGIFAVLWDTTSNVVYVDTNQNRSFADEKAMRDYAVAYDVNYFGVDNPATAIAERMPFVVQTDGKNKYVNIGIVSGAHGSHVAGITTAKGLFGGSANGVAPGAKIVSIRACLFVGGCTSAALLEGMIYVTKQANVDVVNMSIGGLPSLNDGNNARALLYNRLIEQTKAQMFFSAGNSGPGINTVGDPAVTGTAMSMGASVTKESWLANYGAIADRNEGLFVFSSRGPSEAGGFKPNLVAPGSAVSSVPMWQPGQPVAGTYALPPGYAMFNGTSMAAPMGAGAAALLISAAKQTGAQYQPDQLRQAMNSSARFLTAYQAHEQGNGLLRVSEAWNLLRTNIKTDVIISKAPVNTTLSQFLATPSFGTGIYEREGWSPGRSGTRTITFTRTKGAQGGRYAVSWVGNDGTFSSPSSLSLPLNVPVNLTVNINPQGPGVHSAILNLDGDSALGVEYQVLNTIVVADQFTGPDYAVTRPATAERPDKATFFMNIPTGTPAFKLDLTDVTGRVRMLRFHPYGVPLDLDTVGYQTGGTQSRTTPNPQPGVWEVTVDTSRTSVDSPAAFKLTSSLLGASVSPNPDMISSATIGVPVARAYTLTNIFGAFTGRAVGTALGSAARAKPTIANLAQQQFVISVMAGSTSLRVTIGGTSDPGADLDLLLFNCTTGTCVLAGQSADGDSEESVTVVSPAAGTWVALVDGYSIPAGKTEYNYIDIFANPAFGAIAVTDANALRPVGSSWNVPAAVTANAAPAAGRVLFGNVQVRTDANILVGSGDVIVQSVGP
jgi:hypothetical protein